tara:strand:- start:160 stop:360 length:201 start_codon:yes stop_codon:yes gene_type:complete
MNNVELTEKELVTLVQLVRSARDEVHESLDYRDEDGDSIPMGSRPAHVLSRDYESLQALLNKLGGA